MKFLSISKLLPVAKLIPVVTLLSIARHLQVANLLIQSHTSYLQLNFLPVATYLPVACNFLPVAVLPTCIKTTSTLKVKGSE